MSKALETLTEAHGAEVVGGQIIAVVDGKHIELGVLNHDELVLNETGQALLKKAQAAPPADDGDEAPTHRKPRGGRHAAPAPEAPAEPEPAPVEHTLDVTDEVRVEEQVG